MDYNKNNKKDGKNIEREGVIYTPSSVNYIEPNEPEIKKRPTKKPGKSQYKPLMLITIASGFVICIIVFALVYSMFGGKKETGSGVSDSGVPPGISGDLLPDTEERVGSEFIGVVQEVLGSKKQITVLDITNQRSYSFNIPSGAELRNKFGQSVSLPEFKEGDIVSVKYDGNDISSLKESAEGFEQRSVSNLSIDVISKTAKRNNDSYSFTDAAIVRYKGEPLDISEIKDIDVVTIKGYKDMLWSVNVEKSHGYIQVSGAGEIVSGSIAVDTSIFSELSADKILVAEGVHKIVIEGDNIEPFIKEVLVGQGETYILDLGTVQPKTSVVMFKVNQPDFELKINGVLEFSREPLILGYGEYTMKVTKDGYVDWEEQVNINAPNTEIPVELKKIVNMGKITVNSLPQGADLYVDNAYIGITPVTKDIVQGEHTIILRKEGYKDYSPMDIVVGDGSTVYNVTLQSKDDERLDTSPDSTGQTQTPQATEGTGSSGQVPFETPPNYTTDVPFEL